MWYHKCINFVYYFGCSPKCDPAEFCFPKRVSAAAKFEGIHNQITTTDILSHIFVFVQ